MSTEAAGAAEIEGPADRARRDDAAPPLRRSPLDAWHRGHGARMVAFGGWEMPLEFGDGTLSEHMSCRRRAAVFDVSHLGTVRVTGPGAKDRLEHSLTNSLSKIAPGKAQYTHLLDEDGSVLDDLIVWWVDEQRFDVMPNASNTSRVLEAIGGSDVTEQRAVLAVQEPRSRELLAQVFPDSSQVGHFKVATSTWRGAPVVVAGTGYTGEDGVECAVPSGVATEFWAALVAAGATPAGLGARDTLRLEAGLPLHGHELGPGITPLDAGLSWVVAWDKPGGFTGRDALLAERQTGIRRVLRGVAGEGRQPLRAGYTAWADGLRRGELSSGNFSPVLQHGIGMCFLPPDLPDGAPLEIEARGRRIAAHATRLPFVRRLTQVVRP